MITGNEPAFSKAAFYHPDGGVDSPQEGMSIRQYYAGLAMQGLVANPQHRKIYQGESYLMPSEVYAEQAVSLANALIKELNKPLT